MEILPEELRSEFNNVIDWLHEKACARKSGMGTRLPWDPEWIIESLSDSTIYMAYYTIVRHIKEHKIQSTQLTDDVFDYVFFGRGNAAEIAKKAKLGVKILENLQNDFNYFYPLDSRHSGRDLVPNHLTFMIFNHTAIFPEKLWPRQIATNGSVMMEGAKMSKSFGNIIPLREGLSKFGADPVRLSVLSTAELLQDAEFSPTIAKSMREKLERLYKFASEVARTPHKRMLSGKSLTAIDRWMLSRLQEHIKEAAEAMNKLAVRKAIHSILYALDQDFQWYQKRNADKKEDPKRKIAISYVFSEVLDAQTRMLAPIAPHVCEELWEMMGEEGFVSLASWPQPEASKVDIKAEENEALIMSMLEDTQNIIKATGIQPKKICYYLAASWKWKVYLKALEKSMTAKVVQGDIIRELLKDASLKAIAKEVAEFASKIANEVNCLAAEKKQRLIQAGSINEEQTLKAAADYFKRELNAEICFYSEENLKRYDPKNKARTSKPYRPAIFIE
jgi:leucyl-tRNA synthetase